MSTSEVAVASPRAWAASALKAASTAALSAPIPGAAAMNGRARRDSSSSLTSSYRIFAHSLSMAPVTPISREPPDVFARATAATPRSVFGHFCSRSIFINHVQSAPRASRGNKAICLGRRPSMPRPVSPRKRFAHLSILSGVIAGNCISSGVPSSRMVHSSGPNS